MGYPCGVFDTLVWVLHPDDLSYTSLEATALAENTISRIVAFTVKIAHMKINDYREL